MKTKSTEIQTIIDDFKIKAEPEDRYTSFDYCYNYFLTTEQDYLIKDIEKSCLTIGFYLASWGMFRGSSFLLGKSAKYFKPTIKYLATLDKSIWLIDVDNYAPENIETIIQIYNNIKKCIIIGNNSDLTLITKIMLGVFGFIPAYDQYFCDTFRQIFANVKCGFRRVNQKSLKCIKVFYDANKQIIDEISVNTFTTNFETGAKTKINYPKAKIIDMYGFTVGLKKNEITTKNKRH